MQNQTAHMIACSRMDITRRPELPPAIGVTDEGVMQRLHVSCSYGVIRAGIEVHAAL
jgi:hypothetical protein